MKRRTILGPIVIASIIMLGGGQAAVAQVDWTYHDPVVLPGPPGSWNEGRHLVGDVVFDGTDYHMYLIGGPGGNALNNRWSVGHWTSNDLMGPWEPDPCNPVLEPETGAWDAYSIQTFAVLYDEAIFKIWYGAAATYHGVAHGGYATNANGFCDWEKYAGNPLVGLDPGAPGAWDEGGPGPSSVLFDGTMYRMWYTSGHGDPDPLLATWAIGHATSTDGLSWIRDPNPVLEATDDWEGDKLYFSEVVRIGDGFAMWYSGLIMSPSSAAIGYAGSPDGLHWGKWPGNPVLIPEPPNNAVDSMSVIFEGNMIHGWVTHQYDVTHVTSPFEVVFFDAFETGDCLMWANVTP